MYTNTQALYFTLDNTALILQIPARRLHFIGGAVGGGFGGKVDVIVEPIAALAAMKTGHPVKYKFSRREEMQVSSSRGAWRMYYKDGVGKDGRIVAAKSPLTRTLEPITVTPRMASPSTRLTCRSVPYSERVD